MSVTRRQTKAYRCSLYFFLDTIKGAQGLVSLVHPLKLTYGIPVETCRLDWRGLVKLGYQDLFVNRAI